MRPNGNQVFEFFRHPEAEVEKGLHIDADLTETGVVGQYKLQVFEFLGHGWGSRC